METKLSPADLVEDLEGILDRVRLKGEQFVIERGGTVIARIQPPAELQTFTWGDFLHLLRNAPEPDAGFADDVEAIQAGQAVAKAPEWAN